MKQIIKTVVIGSVMLWANACNKYTNKELVDNTSQSAMTILAPTIGEQHNAVLSEYQTTYGFNTTSATLTKVQFETIINRSNQIMIDQGLLTGTTAAQQTAADMILYTNSGFFTASNNLRSQSELINIMLGQIQNAAIKTAQANIINYAGNDFETYTITQLDGLISNTALTSSEKTMITGAKDIFSHSFDYWNGSPAEAMNGKYQATIDEMAYVIGFIIAKGNGQTDGIAIAFGLYNAIKMSSAAGNM